MSEVVLDASALLALLNGEPEQEAVARELPRAVIGAVNHSEVVAKLAEGGMPEGALREALDGLALTVYEFDRDLAFQSGLLRPATKARGLSLGDRACLALGMRLNTPVLTADRDWEGLDIGVDIRVLRS